MSGFSVDDIRMLAELERKMDSGEFPFVMHGENRLAVRPEIMDELKLTQGQTVNSVIVMAIMEASLASLESRIAMDKISQGESS